MREEPATTGQMLDFFRDIRVQAQRPNKLRLDVASDTSNVSLWYDGKTVTLMPETGKMYTTLQAPGTIEGALRMLKTQLHTTCRCCHFFRATPMPFFPTA